MSVIFSNGMISTSEICVFVQVGILINIQTKNDQITFMFELEQENRGTDVSWRISLIS